jgi:hypothetical protein
MRRLPMENSSPSPKPRAGRMAKSLREVRTPISVPNSVCVRSGCQEVVQGAKFIAFKMRSTDPAQLPGRHDFRYSFEHERGQLAISGVEKQRFVIGFEIR